MARLVSKDAITSPLRVPFTTYRESGGPGKVMEDVRQDGQLRHAVGELVSCPLCLSVWVATGFSILSRFPLHEVEQHTLSVVTDVPVA